MPEIRSRVERAVEAVVLDKHGSGALARVPISSTCEVEVTRPVNYLHGVEAARSVSYAADSVARDYAKKAREEGRSWEEVAQALGIKAEASQAPAVEAFLWVAPAPPQRYDTIRTWWECASCHARVSDTGPFSGNPDDNEEGHAAGCARHAADVDAWRKASGWDEDLSGRK